MIIHFRLRHEKTLQPISSSLKPTHAAFCLSLIALIQVIRFLNQVHTAICLWIEYKEILFQFLNLLLFFYDFFGWFLLKYSLWSLNLHVPTNYTVWLKLFRYVFFQIDDVLIFNLLNFGLLVNGWFLWTFKHGAFIYINRDALNILLINYVELRLHRFAVNIYSWKNEVFVLGIEGKVFDF
jgi:hypothetical protein